MKDIVQPSIQPKIRVLPATENIVFIMNLRKGKKNRKLHKWIAKKGNNLQRKELRVDAHTKLVCAGAWLG